MVDRVGTSPRAAALRSRGGLALAVVLVALGASMTSAEAQTARSGGNANAQLLQQMQQLASERTSLQADNAKLKKDLEAMRKERDTLKGSQQGLERRAKTSEASIKALQEEAATRRQSADEQVAHSREQLQQLIAKYKELAQTLRDVETDRATTKQTLSTRDDELKVCTDRNAALYKLNQEVLTRLENQGLFGRMARAEPFTKIKRVELQNLVDEYKGRADDQVFKPGTLPPTRVAPPTPAAPPLIASPATQAAPPTASSPASPP